jgi:hypothetical protein
MTQIAKRHNNILMVTFYLNTNAEQDSDPKLDLSNREFGKWAFLKSFFQNHIWKESSVYYV